MPTQGSPKLTVRIDPEKRARFVAEAYNAGTTGSEEVLNFIDYLLGEPGAALPQPFADRKEPDRA